MRKMNQITTASLKLSILALLFFVTAAPSIIENGRSISLHQENLKGGNSVASGNLDHFPVAPTTNEMGTSNLGVADTTDFDGRNLAQQPAGQVVPESMEDFGEEFAPTANNNIGYEPAGQVAPESMEDFGEEFAPTANTILGSDNINSQK